VPLDVAVSNSFAPPAAATPAKTNGQQRPRAEAQLRWISVGHVTDFPDEGGAAIKYGQV